MNQVLHALEAILKRLIRLETKVAKLMEHSGLSADGRTPIKESEST